MAELKIKIRNLQEFKKGKLVWRYAKSQGATAFQIYADWAKYLKTRKLADIEQYIQNKEVFAPIRTKFKITGGRLVPRKKYKDEFVETTVKGKKIFKKKKESIAKAKEAGVAKKKKTKKDLSVGKKVILKVKKKKLAKSKQIKVSWNWRFWNGGESMMSNMLSVLGSSLGASYQDGDDTFYSEYTIRIPKNANKDNLSGQFFQHLCYSMKDDFQDYLNSGEAENSPPWDWGCFTTALQNALTQGKAQAGNQGFNVVFQKYSRLPPNINLDAYNFSLEWDDAQTHLQNLSHSLIDSATSMIGNQANVDVIPETQQPLGHLKIKYINYPIDKQDSIVKEGEQNYDCAVDFLSKLMSLDKDYIKSLVDINYDDWKGLTTEQIRSLCIREGHDMLAINLEGKVISRYNREPRNHHKPSVLFMKANNHLYPITDTNLKKKLQNTLKAKEGLSMFEPKEKKVKIVEKQYKYATSMEQLINIMKHIDLMKDKVNVLYTGTCLRPLIHYYLKEHNICIAPMKLRKKGGKSLKKLIIKGVCIIANRHFNETKAICEAIGDEFNNKSIHTLGHIFCEKLKIKIPREAYSKQVKEQMRKNNLQTTIYTPKNIVLKNEKGNTYLRDLLDSDLTFDEMEEQYLEEFDIKNEFAKIDITKAYTSQLYHCDTNFYIHTILDDIKAPSDKIIDSSSYLIRTNDDVLFKGHGVYPSIYVKTAIQDGIPFDIVGEIPASYELPATHFKELVKNVYFTCICVAYKKILSMRNSEYKYLRCLGSSLLFTKRLVKKWIKHAKVIMNSFVGTLTSKESIDTRFIYTTSKNDLFNIGNEWKGDSWEHVNITDKILELHLNTHKSTHTSGDNIRRTIIHNINMKIYQARKKLGEQNIINIHSDSITYRKTGIEMNLGNAFGQWRDCSDEIPNEYTENPQQINYHEPSFTPVKPWNIIKVNEDGTPLEIAQEIKDKLGKEGVKQFLLMGRAGTGKTSIENELKKFNEFINYDTLAPTNLASIHNEGETLHKYFSLDFGMKTNKRTQNKIRKVDGIIIDEVSMIHPKMWKVIFNNTKDKKIIGIGDLNQLKPVGYDRGFDFYESEEFKERFGYNKIVLCKNKRQTDPFFWKLHEKILQNKPINYSNFFGNKFTDTNICYTNEYKAKINKHINVRINNFSRKKYHNGLFHVYKKCKVIATKNNLKIEENSYVNNERFSVVSWNKETITLKSEVRDDRIITIVHSLFNNEFELGYALTGHQVQGWTINFPHTIHQTDHYYAKEDWRYVAFSRTTKKEFINVMKQIKNL